MLDRFVWLSVGLAGAYALGCLSHAYYVVHFVLGRDIRQQESGTAGATNVSRLLGRKVGAAVALADIAKGAAAVWFGTLVVRQPEYSPLIMAAAVAGHIWPVQLGFRGGKGLAAGFGALLWFSPATAGVAALLNLCLSLPLRSATLGTLVTTALTPALAFAVGISGWSSLMLAIPCGLIVLSHRNNLRRAIELKFRRAQKP